MTLGGGNVADVVGGTVLVGVVTGMVGDGDGLVTTGELLVGGVLVLLVIGGGLVVGDTLVSGDGDSGRVSTMQEDARPKTATKNASKHKTQVASFL